MPVKKPRSARPGVPGAPLADDRIEPEAVENMRTSPHGGFSVDQSLYLPTETTGIERLVADHDVLPD